MHLLFIVHAFPPDSIRGAQVQTLQLARELARAHDVSVAYPVDGGGAALSRLEEDVFQGLRIFKARRPAAATFPLSDLVQPEMEAAFEEVVQRSQPHVVHVQHLLGWPASIVERTANRGIPCVATLRDWYPMCPRLFVVRPDWSVCEGPAGGLNCHLHCREERFGWPPQGRLRRLAAVLLARLLGKGLRRVLARLDDLDLFRYALRDREMRRVMKLFDRVLCPSRFLMSYFARGWVAPQRLAFCEHGFDRSRFDGLARRPSQVPRFAFLSGICYLKGADLLVDAFNQIDPSVATLDVYGDLDRNHEAIAIRARAANPSISFHGEVDNARVGEVLSQVDCVVLPSRMENSPIVIREAYLAGLPVIASRRAGNPELVQHEVNGLLFEPNSVADLKRQIERIIREPGLRERLAANVPPVRSIADQAAELTELYERLIREKAPRREGVPHPAEMAIG